MAIKWIVTDMDGTLLNDRDEISDSTVRALINCQQQGIKLILASGRSYSRLTTYMEQLRMKEYAGSLIEVNGMALNHLNGDRRIFGRLQKKDIETLFPYFQTFEIELQGYLDTQLFYWIPECLIPFKIQERKERNLPEDYPWTGGAWSWVNDSRGGYPHQTRIESVKDLPPELNKINCIAAPETIRRIQEVFKESFADKYEFARTCPRLIEVAPAGITKGQTLRRYMEIEGVLPDEVLVFGDGENDIDMFRQVKYSIAMGNAEDFVKKAAFDVTDTNCREGVLRALKKYLPNYLQQNVEK